MKKVLSILTWSLLITGAALSQGLDWGDFEDSTSMWGNSWGGSSTVVANPHNTTGNTSSMVLMFEPTAGWQGISNWFNDGVLDSTHTSISLDVWADSATNIQLALVNSVDSAPEVFIKDTILTNQWNHIVFDISNLPAYDYQNIAFQNSEVTTFYFDNIMVNTLADTTGGPDTIPGWTRIDVENIVYGSVENDTDFNAHVLLKWDPDTLHMIFHIVDDSIVNEGTTYQVDNIEIYIDADNSKNVHWPRNGGWVANDIIFDENDYQFRLIPGLLWDDATENRISNAKFEYVEDSAGYTFHISLLWDSIMPDLNPSDSTMIGFDVLISDNDATASDPNRNQITWNAPTTYPFNDPSLWGTLQLDSAGTFTVVADTTAPAAPTNVMATAAGQNVTVTWDASTDDIAVHQYVVHQDNVAVDTVFALQTANSHIVNNLDSGTYTFSIVALDIYGNASASASAAPVTVVGDTTGTAIATKHVKFNVYPNPASSYITISNISDHAYVNIYNNAGQLVLKQVISNNQYISLSGLNSGLYNLQVIDKNGTAYIKLLKK